MASTCRVSILSFLIAYAAYAQVPNPDADPFSVVFSNDTSIGPDGPWLFIPQAIDFPNQMVNMLPGITQLSLAIADTACSSQSAVCPLPIPVLWQESGAWEVSGGPQTISKAVDGEAWDLWTSSLLRLKGSGKFFQERITLFEDGVDTADAFLDNHGMMLSESYMATFPGGAAYTLDSGFLSLYGGANTISWKAASNGSSIEFNRTLPDAYLAGYAPSISYGLQVGSATHNVPASLVVGGYDSSRCLTEPIVSDSQSVHLTKISLGVASGGSAYTSSISSSANLLKENGQSAGSLEVYPNPSVPYMYLPKDTCDALASYLPVTYNEAFNLYFWDTNSDAYRNITSSPHYIGFTFTSSNGESSTINIAFALLDLKLESPLVSASTPYFPCSPWTLNDAPYHLGRAFLQGAVLAQNWQTNKLFLAQAPGPDLSLLPPYVKKISTSDTSITPAINPPSWLGTWSGTLKALPANSESEDSSPAALSTAAIAGIAVGSVFGITIVAAVLICMIRRRKKHHQHPNPDALIPNMFPGWNGHDDIYMKEQYPPSMYEVHSEHRRPEIDGTDRSELAASTLQGSVYELK